ncbi:hypothetical protein SCE1572_39650 [Sorangium cellulosum So0157-2]|uniref:Uncharacterized protein n=1 Tax=Sorangium cellulosum So0157-2 TaxID=1254432 RepID=S4Y792_SORCE|nr:hypothetical protein SCE1572_39650 [Sorangium cellulosum So0157-2]
MHRRSRREQQPLHPKADDVELDANEQGRDRILQRARPLC